MCVCVCVFVISSSKLKSDLTVAVNAIDFGSEKYIIFGMDPPQLKPISVLYS